MNRLARAKSLAHAAFTSSPPRNYLSFVHPIQRALCYSTKTADTPKSIEPKSQKSSESTLSASQRIKKQAEAAILWPRPREIPYQAKVANLVNIIGHVKIPVKFETDSDGKHLAATFISHEQEGEKNSLLIPVVFEGDLAHVVACHVKQNDCVFVTGQLSTDPGRLVLSESVGRLHIVVENLNFVEGMKRTYSGYTWRKKGAPISGVGIDRPLSQVVENVDEIKVCPDSGEVNVGNVESVNSVWRESLERTKIKTGLDSRNSIEDSVWPPLFSDSKETAPAASSQLGNEGKVTLKESFKPEKGNEESKAGDLWRDVVMNPLQWWDYRPHKSNLLVKEKFPDFKHKVTGEGLWIDRAPEWVLAGLGKLEFDVKTLYPNKQAGGVGGVERKKDDKGNVAWKNLVENPDKWWDNRSNKRNQNFPDFKHKETGEVLWLDKSPVWALPMLPPLRASHNT